VSSRSISARTQSGVSSEIETGGLLLFVTVNDHLTLALKSFTGLVERERETERGREGAEGKPIHYERGGGGRGGGGRGEGAARTDGWMD